MKTVGQILKDTRLSQQRTLHDLSIVTHIREDFLEALEHNAFEKVPKGPFAQGFLSAYARELGLDPTRIVAVYRRDYGKKNDSALIPKGVVKPIQQKKPKEFLQRIGAGFIMTLIVGGFVFWQWKNATQPPRLVVLEPVQDQKSKSPIIVRGNTATDAIMLVNTQSVGINQDGDFYTELQLTPGEHAVVVEAQNRTGESRIVQRNVFIIE